LPSWSVLSTGVFATVQPDSLAAAVSGTAAVAIAAPLASRTVRRVAVRSDIASDVQDAFHIMGEFDQARFEPFGGLNGYSGVS